MSLKDKGSQYIYVPQGSLYFDGSNDYVTCDSGNKYRANKMTVSLWVQGDDTDATDSRNVFGIRQSATRYYYLRYPRLNTLDLDIVYQAGGSQSTMSFGTMKDNKWHHIAITSDDSNLKVYYDGTMLSSSSIHNLENCFTTTPILYIGSASEAGSFEGSICDFRFYSGAALDKYQIKELANGIDVRENLVTHYPFNDRKGTDLKARGNYGSDGTITNATWKDRPIRCWNSRWDEDNWGVILETFMDACDRNYIFRNVTPGALRELYNILGTPRYIDTTYKSGNTLIFEPLGGYGISSVAQRRVVGVKNISDTFLRWDLYGIKIECTRLDI